MSSPRPRPPERLVCPWMLRRLFAERQILQRVDRGEIRTVRRLKTPIGQERRHAFPPSTMTRMIDYVDAATGTRLCETHQYECIHGRILASGLPDPKTFWDRRRRSSPTAGTRSGVATRAATIALKTGVGRSWHVKAT